MDIEVVVQQYEQELVGRTLCFLLESNKVLLGLKKTGFGKGNIVGIGGGIEDGELPIDAAIREVKEEVGLTLVVPKLVGVMDFYFPHAENPKSWNQRVFVYLGNSWIGEVVESDEIAPEWYDSDGIPFEAMWDDNRLWLPEILNGQELWCRFIFNTDLKVESWIQQPLNACQF